MEGVNTMLANRDAIMKRLKVHLNKAQARIKAHADSKCTNSEFKVDHWVLLKLKPYKQSFLAYRRSNKLSKCYFSPFKILERLGSVAYHVESPPIVKVHNVFHVDLLKDFNGPVPSEMPELPSEFDGNQPFSIPEQILDTRELWCKAIVNHKFW